MWSLKQDKIDEIISFLKVSQTPKSEIQKGIFKVNIYLKHFINRNLKLIQKTKIFQNI